jgi:hypothetical protein
VTRHALPEGPDPTGDEPDAAPPSRPAAVELGAALLIVGGVISALSAVSNISSLPPGTGPILALTVALAIGSIVVGLLVRLGRFWLVAVNYAAVLGFLDLLGAGASPLALMLGLADITVVVILFRCKAWFDALRLRRSTQPLTPPTARPPIR